MLFSIRFPTALFGCLPKQPGDRFRAAGRAGRRRRAGQDAGAACREARPGRASHAGRASRATPEYVESRTFTINGEPNRQLSIGQLTRQLGRPDSIARGAVECGGALDYFAQKGDDAGDWWYYGRTMYEVNGFQVILNSFDVTTGRFRGRLGQLVLDQHTTIEDVGRFFPRTVRDGYGPATGRPGQEISLPFYHQGQQMEDWLVLLFEQGRLREVGYWSPC